MAPSSKRNIADSDWDSSAAKFLMKRTLWSAYAYAQVNVRKETSEIDIARETLIIFANPRQVNTLLHPDALEHMLSANSRTLENTRRAKCARRDQDELRPKHNTRVLPDIRVEQRVDSERDTCRPILTA